MPIYTRTGDKGTTALYGGRRIAKYDDRVEAYGSVDELTSMLGLVAVEKITPSHKKLIIKVQKDLYEMMAYLANAPVPIVGVEPMVKEFERNIDNLSTKLPKLTRFILPGGTKIASLFLLWLVFKFSGGLGDSLPHLLWTLFNGVALLVF